MLHCIWGDLNIPRLWSYMLPSRADYFIPFDVSDVRVVEGRGLIVVFIETVQRNLAFSGWMEDIYAEPIW